MNKVYVNLSELIWYSFIVSAMKSPLSSVHIYSWFFRGLLPKCVHRYIKFTLYALFRTTLAFYCFVLVNFTIRWPFHPLITQIFRKQYDIFWRCSQILRYDHQRQNHTRIWTCVLIKPCLWCIYSCFTTQILQFIVLKRRTYLYLQITLSLKAL